MWNIDEAVFTTLWNSAHDIPHGADTLSDTAFSCVACYWPHFACMHACMYVGDTTELKPPACMEDRKIGQSSFWDQCPIASTDFSSPPSLPLASIQPHQTVLNQLILRVACIKYALNDNHQNANVDSITQFLVINLALQLWEQLSLFLLE